MTSPHQLTRWVWLLGAAVVLSGCGPGNGLTERVGVNTGYFGGAVVGVVTSADGTCIREAYPSFFNPVGGSVCFTQRAGRLGDCVIVSSHNGPGVKAGPPERLPVTWSHLDPGGCSGGTRAGP